MRHTFQHRLDAVLVSRGVDPHVPDVYRLQDDSDGNGPFIASWTPPDSSYGEQPTAAELAAVTEAQGDASKDAHLEAIFERMLASQPLLDCAIEAMSSATGEDIRAQVMTAMKERMNGE
jgi:hypothetical protein